LTHVVRSDFNRALRQEMERRMLGYKVRTGLWYRLPTVTSNRGFVAPGANSLCAGLFWTPRRVRIDRIGCYVETAGAAGERARLGIYRENGDLYPGELAVDGGEVAVDAVGHKELVVDVVLEPGHYFIALVTNSGAARFYRTWRAGMQVIGSPDTSNLGRVSWYVSYTYGALPDPFPAGAVQAGDGRCFGMVRIAELLE